MITLGGDLDLDGAIVVLGPDGRYKDHIRFPTMAHNSKGVLKRRIDCQALVIGLQDLLRFVEEDSQAFLEWPGVVASNGMLRSASQHRTLGNIEAALASLGVVSRYIPVLDWKVNFNLKGKPKKDAIPIANKLCDMEVVKVKDTPIAEAALVARYGMRIAKGGR